MSIHPTAKKIYDKVKQELGLPDPLPEQFGITPESINDAFLQCLKYNYTEKGAEELILKMWKNSIQLK